MTAPVTADVARALLDAYGAAHDEATRGDATSTLYAAAPDLAAQVLALAEALTTAERDLAASRQAHAELAALVRAYLAASDRYEAAWAPMLVHDGPPLSDEAVAAAVAGPDAEMGAARAALDAALGRCP